MVQRNIEDIRTTLAKIGEQSFQKDMIIEIKQAKKLLKDLEYVEMVGLHYFCGFVTKPEEKRTSLFQARKDVIRLHQSRVSEIRSYGNPPPGVHEIMMAVYLLLDYNPAQLQVRNYGILEISFCKLLRIDVLI